MHVKNNKESEIWRTCGLGNYNSRGRGIKLEVSVKKDSATSVMLYYRNKKTRRETHLDKMLTLMSSEW